MFCRRSRSSLKLTNSLNFKALKPDQLQFCSGVQTNHKQMSIYWCAHLFSHPEPFRELFQKEGNIHLWGNRKCFPMSLPRLMRLLIQTDYWQKSLLLFFLGTGQRCLYHSFHKQYFLCGAGYISTHLVISVHLVPIQNLGSLHEMIRVFFSKLI